MTQKTASSAALGARTRRGRPRPRSRCWRCPTWTATPASCPAASASRPTCLVLATDAQPEDACQGDSGGPPRGHPLQGHPTSVTGISQLGRRVRTQGQVRVCSTKVSNFLKWIDKIMRAGARPRQPQPQ